MDSDKIIHKALNDYSLGRTKASLKTIVDNLDTAIKLASFRGLTRKKREDILVNSNMNLDQIKLYFSDFGGECLDFVNINPKELEKCSFSDLMECFSSSKSKFLEILYTKWAEFKTEVNKEILNVNYDFKRRKPQSDIEKQISGLYFHNLRKTDREKCMKSKQISLYCLKLYIDNFGVDVLNFIKLDDESKVRSFEEFIDCFSVVEKGILSVLYRKWKETELLIINEGETEPKMKHKKISIIDLGG